MAVACAGRAIGVRVTIYIPQGAAAKTLELLKGEGAEVIVGGRFYAEALEAAQRAVDNDTNA